MWDDANAWGCHSCGWCSLFRPQKPVPAVIDYARGDEPNDPLCGDCGDPIHRCCCPRYAIPPKAEATE